MLGGRVVVRGDGVGGWRVVGVVRQVVGRGRGE